MVGLTYATYVEQIATMAVVQSTDVNYLTIVPSMIDYAELRMQRDLDFLSTQISNSSYSFSTSNNTLTIPTSSFVSLQTFEVIDGTGNSTPLLAIGK